MKLAYVANNKPSKYNDVISKFSYRKFRNTMMGLLQTIMTALIGVNVGAISIEKLMTPTQSLREAISLATNICGELAYWSVLLFAMVMFITFIITTISKSSFKETVKEYSIIVGGTALMYLGYVAITFLFV